VIGVRLLRKQDGTYIIEIQKDAYNTIRRIATSEEIEKYANLDTETVVGDQEVLMGDTPTPIPEPDLKVPEKPKRKTSEIKVN
jgi:hypothetical protein